MIYNSNRTGKQADSKDKAVISSPGTDVRSGGTFDRNIEFKIIPTGKKSRRVIVVDGRIAVG